MPMASAVGKPSLSGTYIPNLFAAKLIVALYSATVLGAIANTDYEGQIKEKGDKVTIRGLPEITIRDYTPGQVLQHESPTPTSVDLNIDKAKYFAIGINDVDRVQSDIEYANKWAEHGGQKLRIAIETPILADIIGDVATANQGATAGAVSSSLNLGTTGTPLVASKANIVDQIVDFGTCLDEQDVPEENRWLVLPPWACANIKKSDLKDASLSGDPKSPLRNGVVGMVDRFTIYRSNLLSATATYTSVIFGHPMALTFASQLTKNETLKNPQDFGDLLRSLAVYGYQVVKPEAMGLARIHSS